MREAAALRQELVAAFRPYVIHRLAEQGIEAPEGLDASLYEGEVWLRDELAAVTEVPFVEQRRSPLEVFQEAMRFPTEALSASGIPEPARDPAATELLPGDRYDLAPASSQALGESAWQAHLAWGVAKARALSGPAPAVGWLGRDLMDRSRIEAALEGTGLELWPWISVTELEQALEVRPPVLALVDLAYTEADDGIRALAEAGVRAIAYGPHVDDVAMVRARSLGAEDAVARSRFFASIGSYLPQRT